MTATMVQPEVGKQYRVQKEDWGDAGMFLAVGTIIIVEENGERIRVVPYGKHESVLCDGGWSWYLECGPMLHPDDGHEMDVLEQFWFYCMETTQKRRRLRQEFHNELTAKHSCAIFTFDQGGGDGALICFYTGADPEVSADAIHVGTWQVEDENKMDGFGQCWEFDNA